jgi:hypothetical protein
MPAVGAGPFHVLDRVAGTCRIKPQLTDFIYMIPFSRRDALPLIRQIIAGLQAAHDAGVIHRDFKSGNVILANRPEGSRPVITDFGLAHVPGSAHVRHERRAGTPGYMAPEQLEGGPITPATDCYSLGVVIAEMVGARQPAVSSGSLLDSPARDPHPGFAVDGKKLGAWQPIIERCLQKDPAARYQRPADVFAALERASAHWTSPRRILAIATIAALLLAAAVWFWADRTAGRREPDWLLVSALDNRAGEPVLDESVPFLLEREISNFADVYVVPQGRVDDALLLMKSKFKGRVDEKLAREVCRRDEDIRLIAGCRAERIGAALQLTAWETEAASGRMLGSDSETVQTLEDTGMAVRRLAAGIRRAAGQRHAGSREEFERVEKVTTPSLKACQLYSQAYREGDGNHWALAEQMARAALAEDPEFASAHLWLYYALNNQNKAGPEALSHLEQAVAFSGSATERERAFILTVQRNQNTTDEEKIVNWRRMLAGYPDHF